MLPVDVPPTVELPSNVSPVLESPSVIAPVPLWSLIVPCMVIELGTVAVTPPLKLVINVLPLLIFKVPVFEKVTALVTVFVAP